MVIDTLKPRDVSIVEIAHSLINLNSITHVEINVAEIDVKTETLRITLVGENIDLKEVEKTLEKHAAVIRSIDFVAAEK